MPNQLAKSKRRQSLAEHAAVLRALEAVAHSEKTSVMALLREAARDLIRRRVSDPALVARVRRAVWEKAPQMPVHFKTAAQVARFKREQREYDQVLLDLALASPDSVQERNSVTPKRQPIRLIGFSQARA